jgi:L-ascorbate metabolism protein UlaG (beta-lactamase superfamily)
MSLPHIWNEDVYLKPQVTIEPLVCGWYAWPHLIAPAQHAMNVLYRHIPLLRSFVQSTAVHVASSRDPSLYGGPFVDLPAGRVQEVSELIAETERRCAQLIELARDIKACDRELQKAATGYSLSEYYARMPQSLRGLVEFLYDLNDHPKMRFHEELLYALDASGSVQEIALAMIPERERKFFMSTPRLASRDSLHFEVPFQDARIDRLAAMRTRAARLADMAAELGVREQERATFASCFTLEAPCRAAPEYAGDGMRIRYFGHACVLVQIRGTSILLDPMVAFDADKTDGRFTFCDLPDRIDYVVLSHNHQDHCVPEQLLQLRHRIGTVVVPRNNAGSLADPSMKLALRALGFADIRVVDPFDAIAIPGGRITSLPFPGEHVDLDIHTRQGVLIEALGRKLMFLVDSDGWDPMLFRRVCSVNGGNVDALFVGMECHGAPLTWLYGPLLTRPISRKNDESRRLSGLDSARAWSAVQELRPARVFVYAMGQEPWLKYVMGLEYQPGSVQLGEVAAFLDRCDKSGIAAEQLHISKELELAAQGCEPASAA